MASPRINEPRKYWYNIFRISKRNGQEVASVSPPSPTHLRMLDLSVTQEHGTVMALAFALGLL